MQDVAFTSTFIGYTNSYRQHSFIQDAKYTVQVKDHHSNYDNYF